MLTEPVFQLQPICSRLDNESASPGTIDGTSELPDLTLDGTGRPVTLTLRSRAKSSLAEQMEVSRRVAE